MSSKRSQSTEVASRAQPQILSQGGHVSRTQFRHDARLKKQAVFLRIAADRGLVAKSLASNRAMTSRTTFRLLQNANLVGIGYGAKETAGKITGDLAVRVYVRRKIPLADLALDQKIPRFVAGIATDVIPIGQPRFHSRPAHLGIGISHVRGKAGSLGCLVRKPGDEAWYILSACHVLALSGAGEIGDLIVEPPAPSATSTRLAVLADFEPLQIGDEPNRFDAAVARLDHLADVTNMIPAIGEPQWPLMEPLLYQSVRKHGATSLHTVGVVLDTQAEGLIVSGGQSYAFADVVFVGGAEKAFSLGGDSGALVVDAMSRRAVGLVVGGTARGTFISPLKAVFRRFGLEAPTSTPVV